MADLLPSDLWCFIGYKLESTGDRIRFRAVCKSWRSALPFRLPPLLMLSEEEPEPKHVSDDESEEEPQPQPKHVSGDESEILWLMLIDSGLFSVEREANHPRGFVSVGDQTVRRIDFPGIYRARVVGSTGNWLITMHLDKTMRLSNPFSGLQFHLPSFTTFRYGGLDHPRPHYRGSYFQSNLAPEIYRDGLVWKVVLSSAPRSGSDRDCVAVAVHYNWQILAVARPGDASWMTVRIADSKMTNLGIEDMVFYKNQLYAVTDLGRLMVCDIWDDSKPPRVSFVSNPLFEKNFEKMIYLVERADDLLMVEKYIDDFDEMPLYQTNTFKLHKFDFVNNRFEELTDLGEYSLFLGFNTSVSVRASDYFGLVRKNSVYFTDDNSFGYRGEQIPGGRDMGVFDLEDGSIRPHFSGTSTSLYSPPVWVVRPQH